MRVKLTVGLLVLLLVVGIITISTGCASTNNHTVATVNGEKITKSELNDRLMQKAGKQVLDEMITEKLILQEAANENVRVEQQEIDERIAEIEKQFPDEASFLNNLKENNMTLDQAKERIKLQVIVKKMLGKRVKISEEEIRQYFEQNKAGEFKNRKFEETKEQIKSRLQQQMLYSNQQTWIAELKNKAKVELR